MRQGPNDRLNSPPRRCLGSADDVPLIEVFDTSQPPAALGVAVGMAAADKPPEYQFTKAQVPRGWSYPLKRSELDRALRKAEATVASVQYALDMTALDQRTYGTLIVTYYGAGVPYGAAGQVWIYVRTVPWANRRTISESLVSVLDAVADWIAGIERRVPVWRDESHRLEVRKDGHGA